MEEKESKITPDESLISYCGFYCKYCPSFISGKCEGCRGDSPLCAIGYRKCEVKPCCIARGYFSCAECTEYSSAVMCKKLNPLSIRFGEFISSTSRLKTIAMIKEQGVKAVIDFMTEKEWVTMKKRNSMLNKKLGKRK